jgi:hypothetical protein
MEPDGIVQVGSRVSAPRRFSMTSKSTSQDTKKKSSTQHPGMMGDGTEEQNLGQPGNPAARIKEDEVDAAFGKKPDKTK